MASDKRTLYTTMVLNFCGCKMFVKFFETLENHGKLDDA